MVKVTLPFLTPGHSAGPAVTSGSPQQKVVGSIVLAKGVTVTGVHKVIGTYATEGQVSSTGLPLQTGPQILNPLRVSPAPNKHNSVGPTGKTESNSKQKVISPLTLSTSKSNFNPEQAVGGSILGGLKISTLSPIIISSSLPSIVTVTFLSWLSKLFSQIPSTK